MLNEKGLACSGRQAIVLLSGGLDSAVTLYFAKKQGFKCYCLIFDYGQRHRREVESAKKIAKVADCPIQIIKINLPWRGSSLLDKNIKVTKTPLDFTRLRSPQVARGKQGHNDTSDIPSTYVPGRNIIFLSFALSYAEAIKAEAIFIGAHIQDYSGYPDCRPEFYQEFSRVIATGTKAGIKKSKIQIKTPLIRKTKAQIIRLGANLGVPFGLTWSCYQGGKKPCRRCDSCYFRARGFQEAGLIDPLLSKSS